jgi:hypothetical protein
MIIFVTCVSIIPVYQAIGSLLTMTRRAAASMNIMILITCASIMRVYQAVVLAL